MIRYERVASRPTAAGVRAYFDEWIAFYQDFYGFPPDIPVVFSYGFDSYRVTYCTVDAVLPGRWSARPTAATGMVSVPRKPGPLSTVVYLHGTSVSFYDAVSNPNIFVRRRAAAPGLARQRDDRHGSALRLVHPVAYDDIYDVYGQTSDVFRQPYASTVEGLFDMQHFFDDVVASLPATTRLLLEPSYYADLTSNPQSPLRVLLRRNAVDNWRPHAPVRVYHSPDDEEVPYDSALVSVARLRHRGADVSVRSLPGFDHVNSWIQAMPRAVNWFRHGPDRVPSAVTRSGRKSSRRS